MAYAPDNSLHDGNIDILICDSRTVDIFNPILKWDNLE